MPVRWTVLLKKGGPERTKDNIRSTCVYSSFRDAVVRVDFFVNKHDLAIVFPYKTNVHFMPLLGTTLNIEAALSETY